MVKNYRKISRNNNCKPYIVTQAHTYVSTNLDKIFDPLTIFKHGSVFKCTLIKSCMYYCLQNKSLRSVIAYSVMIKCAVAFWVILSIPPFVLKKKGLLELFTSCVSHTHIYTVVNVLLPGKN